MRQMRKRYKKRRFLVFLAVLVAMIGLGSFVLGGGHSEAGEGQPKDETAQAKPEEEPTPPTPTEAEKPPKAEKPTYVLVMGVDERPRDVGRTDALFLVRVAGDDVQALSIPRDTRVSLPGHGEAKINAAYVYDGPEGSKQAVESLLGVSVDYYVKVNTAGFRDLVDLIGGVSVNVPKRMYYVDNAQGLVIDLQPGQQVLDGDKAEQFVRFRHDESGDDVSRVKRQQDFLMAAAKKALTPANLPKLPQLISTGLKYVDTDVPLMKQASLAYKVYEAQQKDRIQMGVLPGTADYVNGISYFLPDEAALSRLVSGW